MINTDGWRPMSQRPDLHTSLQNKRSQQEAGISCTYGQILSGLNLERIAERWGADCDSPDNNWRIMSPFLGRVKQESGQERVWVVPATREKIKAACRRRGPSPASGRLRGNRTPEDPWAQPIACHE